MKTVRSPNVARRRNGTIQSSTRESARRTTHGNENRHLWLPILDQLVDGICLGRQGRIFYLNPAAERLLGISLNQAPGHSVCDLLCGHLSTPNCVNCAEHCILRNPVSREKSVTYCGNYKRTSFNGRGLRIRCLKTELWPVPDDPGINLTIIEDDSAHMTMEKEREDWRNMIAHDLRSPLSIVYVVLGKVQQDIEHGAPKKHDAEMLAMGIRNCLRMITLLDCYLDVSKFEAGKMPVEIKELDLSEIVRRCVEEQSPSAQERRIALIANVPTGLQVLADAQLLPRIVQNLLNNALKFAPEGGRVELSTDDGGREGVQLSVSDNGPGIAADEIPRLFDRYHQATARREGTIKGTGLGLAFCQGALGVMKGAISVKSKPGEGSRFIIRLPAPSKKEMSPLRGRSPARDTPRRWRL